MGSRLPGLAGLALLGLCSGWLQPKLHNSPACLTIEAPHDIAAALTTPDGVHHVWQFCIPFGGWPPEAHPDVGAAWQHASSTDLLHWTNHNNSIGVYSGFAVVDDRTGQVCAGQKCSNVGPARTACPGLVVNGSGPMNGTWPGDVPVFLTCALDGALSRWGPQQYLLNPHFFRATAYDSLAWRDRDGYWYVTVATDGCNTTHAVPCPQGSRLDMWRSEQLNGSYSYVGPMLTTNRSALDMSPRGEMVTPTLIGGIPGDPRDGATRLLANNGCNGNSYYMGEQRDGSRLVDSQGLQQFGGPGELGMLDWGDNTYNSSAVAEGKTGEAALQTMHAALPANCHAPYSMARVLAGAVGQGVTGPGRRIVVAWVGNGTWAAQALPRELSLGTDLMLQQRFIPELEDLRDGPPRVLTGSSQRVHAGMQVEVRAAFPLARAAGGAQFGLRVLGLGDEFTQIGVDLRSRTVFLNVSRQDPGWQGAPTAMLPVRAGPLLLGHAAVLSVHCYVDGSFVSVIVNNYTALTAVVQPSQPTAGEVQVYGWNNLEWGDANVQVWRLRAAA